MRLGDVQRSCPLLCALLKQNSPDVFMIAQSSTEGTAENANIELCTRRHFSDERHSQSQQVESSLAAQNYEKTRSHNLDHSGGIHSTPCQRQVSSPSLSGQRSTDNCLPVGNNTTFTDDQIQDMIVQMVACSRTKNYNMGTTTYATNKGNFERQRLNCAVTEQCTTSLGQAYEEDLSKGSKSNAGLTPRSRQMDDCATSASKKHSTEYQQIMGKVAANCTKNEGETPVVLNAVPEMTLDEWTERQPSSSLNKNLDEIYKMPGVSWAVRHMPNRQKGDAGLKPEEAIWLDSVQGVTVDFQTKSSSVVSKNNTFNFTSLIEKQDANAKEMKSIEDQHFDVTSMDMIAHSEGNSAIDKIQIHNVVSIPIDPSEWLRNHRSHEGARKDVAIVHSQTDVNIAHSDTKIKEQAPLPGSECKEALFMNVVKDPQYEDISDDEDMSQRATKLTQYYEDISDENTQNEDVTIERPLLVQEPEPNNKQLPFVIESYGCVHGQGQMKTEVISAEQVIPSKHVSPETETLDMAERCSCEWFLETDDGFEDLFCPKCGCKSMRHLGGQTNHSVSHGPSSVLKDEYETDDQMDDEWIVIPISMSDIRFEPLENQDSPEKDVSDYTSLSPVSPSSSTSPISVFASCQEVEVFDTYDSFCREKAVPLQNTFQVTSGCSTPEHELDYEGDPNTLQSRRELYSDSEDSCETEDSCDYSPGPRQNIMTVSKEYLKKRLASLSPERDNSVTEGEKDQIKKTCERLKQVIAAHAASKQNQLKTNGQKISETNITPDFNTESDQKCKMKAKSKRLFPSASENSGDAECSQQKRGAPEIVDSPSGTENFQRNRLPSADTPPLQHQSKLTNTQSKEVMQDAKSDIILVSDTEDENDQIGNQEDIEMSGQLIEAKCGSEPGQHNGQKISEKESDVIILSDTEDENDQDHGKEEETKKSGQVIEVKRGSEHAQYKTKRHKRKEEERRNVKGILSSGSPDSGDALPATKNIRSTETVDSLNGTANKTPKNPRLSSKDRQEKQPQCVGLEVDSDLGPNPVGPHSILRKSSHPTEYVKDSEVHLRANDEIQAPEYPTGTGRNSREKNIPILPSNKKRVTFKPEVANDRCHLTKKQAKPCLVSRQLSLPSRGAPSTSNCSLSTTSGQISEARQSSACSRGLSQSGRTSTSCSLPKSTQRLSIPGHRSPSKPLLPRSYSSPSTLDNTCTPTKRPSSSATRKKVMEDWSTSFFPTKRDGKSNLRMEGGLRILEKSETRSGPKAMNDNSWSEARLEPRTTNNNSWHAATPGPRTINNNSWHEGRPGPRTTNDNSLNEARPGPSRRKRALRQRHESTTPLMKRAKTDAIEWTKATHRDVAEKQRGSVGDHYKWSEKPTASKPRKGFGS